MSDSLIVDWLNENEQRAFPLKEFQKRQSSFSYTLPDNIILDASLVYPGATVATLDRIDALPTTVVFTLSGGQVFTADKTQPFPQYLRNPNGSLLVIGAHCADIPLDGHIFSNLQFEDTLVYELTPPWQGVSSVKFNLDAPLTGDITLEEGFQFGIDFPSGNLFFGASSDFGIPTDCAIVGQFTNDCEDVISSINGVGPNADLKLFIDAGSDIFVLDDPPNHRIFVGLAFKPGDVCYPAFPTPPRGF